MLKRIIAICAVTFMVISCSDKTPPTEETTDESAVQEETISPDEEQALIAVYDNQANSEITDENADTVAEQLMSEIEGDRGDE